jgi:hypothetical protein
MTGSFLVTSGVSTLELFLKKSLVDSNKSYLWTDPYSEALPPYGSHRPNRKGPSSNALGPFFMRITHQHIRGASKAFDRDGLTKAEQPRTVGKSPNRGHGADGKA